MRRLDVAAGVLGWFSAGCLLAAWWVPGLAWSGVALSALAVVCIVADALVAWAAMERGTAETDRLTRLEQQVEILNRDRALKSLG